VVTAGLWVWVVRQSLTREGSPELLLGNILAMAITATQDKIPNVRFTAAQALAKLSQHMDDATVQTQIR
jgi:hypothetical protein